MTVMFSAVSKAVWERCGIDGLNWEAKKNDFPLKKKYYCCVSFQFLGPREELPSLNKSPTAAFIASWKEFSVMVLAILYMRWEKQQHP